MIIQVIAILLKQHRYKHLSPCRCTSMRQNCSPGDTSPLVWTHPSSGRDMSTIFICLTSLFHQHFICLWFWSVSFQTSCLILSTFIRTWRSSLPALPPLLMASQTLHNILSSSLLQESPSPYPFLLPHGRALSSCHALFLSRALSFSPFPHWTSSLLPLLFPILSRRRRG